MEQHGVPRSGYIIGIFNMLGLFGPDAVVTQEAYYQKYGYYYFHERGETAIFIGVIAILTGLFLCFRYLSGVKAATFRLIQERHWLCSVFLVWVLFTCFPVVEKIVPLPGLSFVGLSLINVVLSFLFHKRVTTT